MRAAGAEPRHPATPGREPPPGPPVARIVAPRWLAARNALRRGAARPVIAALLVAIFWTGCFLFFVRVLGWFQSIGDFGPVLTQRLLTLLLATFFGVLLLSNTITALTTFYLAGDVALLLAAPIDFRRLHDARFVETAVSSSWMILLFGLPVFLAYGWVFDAGAVFHGAVVAAMLPFLVIPAAIGVLLATALVVVMPAHRARDGLLVLVGLLVAGGFVAVRMLRPERLADPAGLAGFASFLVGFGGSPSPALPTTWAAEVLLPLLDGRDGDPLFFLGMLWSTAAMLFLVSGACVDRLFLRAWTRAQEGAAGGSAGGSLAQRIERLAAPLPPLPRMLLAKDLAVFLRDASQWSQLVLLLALVAIYVENFRALPVAEGSPLGRFVRDAAAFCNLGLSAFVVTSVAVRFVYPVVSLEGRQWWILRSAPISLAEVWRSKFWIGFVPLVLFGEILVVATNSLLGIAVVPTLTFAVVLAPLIAAIVSLGLAFGATHPRFDTTNAAQIATGFGAIVYMVACLGLVTLVVALCAWPVIELLRSARAAASTGVATPARDLALGAGAASITALVCGAVHLAARRHGIDALRRIEA